MDYYPSPWRLVVAWALLMGLTIATMLAGQVTTPRALGLGSFAALLLVSWGKAGVILTTYLNLRTAPVWRDGLMVLVGLILAIVLTLFTFAPAASAP